MNSIRDSSRQPHPGVSTSDSQVTARISEDSPLSPSINPPLFHSRLETQSSQILPAIDDYDSSLPSELSSQHNSDLIICAQRLFAFSSFLPFFQLSFCAVDQAWADISHQIVSWVVSALFVASLLPFVNRRPTQLARYLAVSYDHGRDVRGSCVLQLLLATSPISMSRRHVFT